MGLHSSHVLADKPSLAFMTIPLRASLATRLNEYIVACMTTPLGVSLSRRLIEFWRCFLLDETFVVEGFLLVNIIANTYI